MSVIMIVLTPFLAFGFVTLCVISIIRTVKKKKALRLWIAASLCIIALIPVSILGSLSTDNPGSKPVVEQTALPLTLPVLESPDTSQPNKQYYGMMGNPVDLTPLADYINAVFADAESNSSVKLLDDGVGLLLDIKTVADGETLEPILCKALKGKNVAKLWISENSYHLCTTQILDLNYLVPPAY